MTSKKNQGSFGDVRRQTSINQVKHDSQLPVYNCGDLCDGHLGYDTVQCGR